MNCHFHHPNYEEPPCPNPGTHCISCGCSGPCVHEKNLLCATHYAFTEGWNAAQVRPHTLAHGEDCDGVGCSWPHFAEDWCIRLTTFRS